MDQKITDLDVAISMTASDLIPIVDANGNNKVLHGSQVKDYVADAVVSDIDDVKAMISDEYDNTATYAVGDYCIYNNTLYRCTTAISTAEDFNPAHWTATSIASGFAIDSDNSPSAVSVNGTYQIPVNVLAHTFIIVACRRGGYGNSIMFKKDELLTFDNGFTFLATGGGYYTLKCSNTGLLTVTNITNLSEPYILVTGLM